MIRAARSAPNLDGTRLSAPAGSRRQPVSLLSFMAMNVVAFRAESNMCSTGVFRSREGWVAGPSRWWLQPKRCRWCGLPFARATRFDQKCSEYRAHGDYSVEHGDYRLSWSERHRSGLPHAPIRSICGALDGPRWRRAEPAQSQARPIEAGVRRCATAPGSCRDWAWQPGPVPPAATTGFGALCLRRLLSGGCGAVRADDHRRFGRLGQRFDGRVPDRLATWYG